MPRLTFADLIEDQAMRMKPQNVFNISGENDVALMSPRHDNWAAGVLIGFEMKPAIDHHDFVQAQMKCLLSAYNSYFPTLQACLKLLWGIQITPQVTLSSKDFIRHGARRCCLLGISGGYWNKDELQVMSI
jgi:hypothetical protein